MAADEGAVGPININTQSIGDLETKSVDELVASRAHYKGKLTYFRNFLNKLNLDSTTANYVKFKLKTFIPIYDKFDAVQSQLEKVDPTRGTPDERENFDNAYYQVITLAEDMIEHLTPKPPTEPTIPVQIPTSPGTVQLTAQPNLPVVSLPKIEIHKFGGNAEEWPAFYELFSSLIEHDESIPIIQKHHYLRTSMEMLRNF